MEQITSNVLGDLAARIRQANVEARQAELTAAENYIESGRLLLRAKNACQHGEWLPFLAQAGIEERTAQRHMKLAKADLKPDMVSDMGGVIPALDYLAEPNFPVAGEYLFMRRKVGIVGYFGWVWESMDAPGYYHYRVNRISGGGGRGEPSGHTTFTKQAMKPVRMMVDGQSVNIFWHVFCEAMGCRSVADFEVLGNAAGLPEYWEEERLEALHQDLAEAKVWAEQLAPRPS